MAARSPTSTDSSCTDSDTDSNTNTPTTDGADNATSPLALRPVLDTADELRGGGARRRYNPVLVEPILEALTTHTLYDVSIDSEPAYELTCFGLEECPSKTIVRRRVVEGEGEPQDFYAITTKSEAAWDMLYRLAAAESDGLDVTVKAFDDDLEDLMMMTAPGDVAPAIERLCAAFSAENQ